MRSSNPILDSNAFEIRGKVAYDGGMTISGTVNKSLMLLALVSTTALFTYLNLGAATMPIAIGGAIGGFIFALITTFKKEWSPITAPIYALLEGLFLGGISGVFNQMYPGIAIQAVMLTFGVFFCLLAAYKSGLIKATENFKLGIVAATGAIFMVYMASMILGLFNIEMPLIHSNGTFGIIFSLVVVVIAALNLVLDFDFIEEAAANGSPKYMEWYAAFGLLVTLVWLYLEILKLLAKLSKRD
ncbi:MAG: hypothetical protein RLZZ175_2044 [Bacteroidota bacterium]|jgi:uncharacterized YccA/Bax inhibitor family protein